jgi:hypothetical protein
MRWHAHSLFTVGPRRPLNRDARRIWVARAELHRRARRLTCLHVEIGRALLRRLGVDGRLDPAHATIAADAGCCARTVRRALRRLAELGLLTWQRRLVRAGWRAEQTSNAYELHLGDAPPPPGCHNSRIGANKSNSLRGQNVTTLGPDVTTLPCGGQAGRGTHQIEKKEAQERGTAAWRGSPDEARAALAAVRLSRRSNL